MSIVFVIGVQLALKWHPDKNQENPYAEEIVSHNSMYNVHVVGTCK